MREIVLDTETTGLNHKTGDRIIEVGCVELINHIPTGNNLQFYCSTEKKISEALQRFACIVKKGLLECDYVPGIHEFLKQQAASGMPMFVVSGSDEIELQEVFMRRGIMKYFEKVYGSPRNKIENTAKVIQEIGMQKKGCFFGDSRSDYKAAKKLALDFVYVSQFSEWDEGHQISNPKIKNFSVL